MGLGTAVAPAQAQQQRAGVPPSQRMGASRGTSFHVAAARISEVDAEESQTLLAAAAARSDRVTRGSVTSQEFWLSCTVQDLTLTPKQEVGQMVVMMKFHVRAPDFLECLRNGRGELTGRGFSGLSGTDAAAKVETYGNDIIHGVQLAHPPAHLFPVNPLMICRNESAKQATAVNVREHLCWVRYDAAHGILSVQMACQLAVTTPLNFKHFPFDRHVVPMQLATRAFLNADGQTLRWVLPPTIPEWAEPTAHYDDDRKLLVEKVRRSEGEFQHMPAVVLLPDLSLRPNDKPILCLRLQRKATKFILSVSLPIGMLVLLAGSTFFVPRAPSDLQLTATVTSALTVTTFRNTVITNDLPPNLTYLTYADWYIFGTFAFHLVLAWRAVEFGQLRLPIDVLLMTIWLAPHCVLAWLAGRKYTRSASSDDADGDSSLTRFFRQPWETKLRNVRERLTYDGNDAQVYVGY